MAEARDGRSAAGPAETATAAERPETLEFVQVAFAGHNRAGDLGDPAAAAMGVQAAFALLRDAGVGEARLLTGLAEGSDLLAAEAWRALALGPLHAIFPFLEDAPTGPVADLMDSATWLDGAATERAGRNPHLAQTRWLIGAADLLVVLWTGRQARGVGGTADAVRLALEHGVPVLWIRPSRPHDAKLIQPEHLDEDFGFMEFVKELPSSREPLVRAATGASLREALLNLGVDRAGAAAAGQPAAADEMKTGPIPWPWRTYALFRRVMGGRAATSTSPGAPPELSPPSDLAAQPGFVRLTEAHAAADDQAGRLGAVHRSHQIILLAFAILAAVAGSSSALWPNLKLAMVTLELLLALGALLVWLDSERGRRHHRWGEARKLAEDLRLERAAWTLGVSTVPHGINPTSSHLARQVRRLAGLPHGSFDGQRVEAWGRWTLGEVIVGQAAYHHAQATTNGRISHRVHLLENVSFSVLLVVLVGYLLTSLTLLALGAETPHWLGGMVVMAGAIVPAIGAAGLALEATLSLGEQAQRSQVLAARLDSLGARAGLGPQLEQLQGLVRAAVRLQRVEEDHWTENASRRRLYRGG
jgi:hypothetical protein